MRSMVEGLMQRDRSGWVSRALTPPPPAAVPLPLWGRFFAVLITGVSAPAQ